MTVSRRDRSLRAMIPRSRHVRRNRLTASALVPVQSASSACDIGKVNTAAELCW